MQLPKVGLKSHCEAGARTFRCKYLRARFSPNSARGASRNRAPKRIAFSHTFPSTMLWSAELCRVMTSSCPTSSAFWIHMCDHQPQGASDDGSLAGFDFYREDNACCYLAALQHQKLQRAWRTGEEFLASDVAFTIYGLPERLAPRDHVCVSVCYRSTCPLTFATSDTHRFLLGFS